MNYTFDHNLFLLMNFDGGEFMDTLMLSASNPMAWSWLYVLMLYLVWRHCGWKGLVMFIVVAGLALGLSDMIAGIFKHSGLLKNVWASFPARLRPMHTPELAGMIHKIKNIPRLPLPIRHLAGLGDRSLLGGYIYGLGERCDMAVAQD